MDTIVNNRAQHRFELAVEGTVAFINYEAEGDRLILIHTEVPDELSGRSIGTTLVRSVLNEARQRGQRIVPQCEFVRTFIRKNPEFADLIADDAHY